MRSRAVLISAIGGRQVIPPGPTAAFSASDTTVDTNTVVTFTDQSTGSPTSWLWDFGDGTTSTEQNPTHTYAQTGAYTVDLTVTNAGGSDLESKNTYILVTSYLASFSGYAAEWTAERAYTDTSLLTDAAADGDLVAALEDISGNGRHVTNATSGNRPTYVTVGGKPAVKFLDTASKTLASAAFFDSTWNTSWTMYLVVEYHGRGGPKVMVGGNSTNLFVAGELDGGTGMRVDWFTNNNGSRYHGYTDKNKMILCLTYDGTTKRCIVRGYTGSTDNDVSSAMTANLGLTGGITFGDISQGGGFACNFFLFHAILYKAGHGSTLRGDILDFLRTAHLTEPAAGTIASGAGTIRIVADGDSQTVGQGLSAGQEWPALLLTDLGGSYSMSNIAVGGHMISQRNAAAETSADALFLAANTANVYVFWCGTNDCYYGIDANTAYRRIREGCMRRRMKAKVILVNTIDRNDGGGVAGYDTRRAAFNTLLTNNWTDFADYYVDLWADARFQDASVGTYFQGDLVHITAASQVIVKDAIELGVADVLA